MPQIIKDDETAATLAAVDAFNEAFNAHDVDAVMERMTEDAVFESTSPPAGERHEGAAAVRAAWEAFFAASPTAHFDARGRDRRRRPLRRALDLHVAGRRRHDRLDQGRRRASGCATGRSPRSSPT